jgi:hypothetical protein
MAAESFGTESATVVCSEQSALTVQDAAIIGRTLALQGRV